MPTTLDDARWAPVRRDLRRRDATALRVMLGRELDHVTGTDGRPVNVDQILRTWARFGQAVYDEDVNAIAPELGLSAPSGGEPIEWDSVVRRLFDELLEEFPAVDSEEGARCRATFAVFVYAEALVFWEYSVVEQEIKAMRSALAALALAMPDSTVAQRRCRDVVSLAAELMAGMELQLEVEAAIASCAVFALQERAASVRAHLELATARAEELRAEMTDSDLDTHLDALLALVLDDLDGTRPYFAVLADHVAPASAAFLGNLSSRTHDPETATVLRSAAAACRVFEESEAGQWSVFATEARAHRIPLETAATMCANPELATLELASAEVTHLYPFGLPVAGSGTDILPELMAALEAAGATGLNPITTLAGVRVVIDDAPRSDGWLASTSIQASDYRAFRAVFPDHELVLTTADGVTLVGLDVDVRLSGMGNHYVRVRFGTDTRVEGGNLGEGRPGVWNAHDLEQAIRRGGQYAGMEHVIFRARTPGSVDSENFGSLLGLATTIVSDLATAAHQHESSPAEEISRDLAVAEGFLARYSQVLVLVNRAEAVTAGGVRRALLDEADLAGVLGVQNALTAQRALAQSALEWVTYPAAEAAVRARRTLAGRMRRELIWCSGDVSAVFSSTAPHWQSLFTQSLVEFASSLIGVFWRRQQWLRRVVDEAGAVLAARPDERGTGREIAELEETGARLAEAIRHVQLLVDRANEHTLSKDQQGREVLQHLMTLNGVAELQQSLRATVQAALSTQRFLQERLDAERRHEEALAEEARREAQARADAVQAEIDLRAERRRQRPLEIVLAVLAVVSLIDLFAWVNDALGLTGNILWWAVETAVILGVAVLLFWLSHRAWRSERNDL